VIDPSHKRDLRRTMRALRVRLAAEAPDAAARAAQALDLAVLPPFACLSGYHPLGAELDPGPLTVRLRDAGATLALPVCEGRDLPLVFRAWDPRDILVPDALGVPSPPASAALAQPDLVIAPLLAFDRRGGRLGQGGGHYDRTLETLRARKPVFVLGLAYAGQELDSVPGEAHDQRLDAILTETGYIEVQRDQDQ
jgi:5-formyltetrahydrofolate cyclo-ligase